MSLTTSRCVGNPAAASGPVKGPVGPLNTAVWRMPCHPSENAASHVSNVSPADMHECVLYALPSRR